jgi:sulfite exporter TauE/SafE/copper chaperone CopZ
MANKKIAFKAEGVVCNGCEDIIKQNALAVKGVKDITFNYKTQSGTVIFDGDKTDIKTIFKKIHGKGYSCSILGKEPATPKNNVLGIVFGLIGIILVVYFLLRVENQINLPQISKDIGYGLLFVVGLLTGFHCIAMCGGFVVSYTANDAQKGKSPYKSHLMYASGKLLSYTVIGAIFGLIGSVIAFTPMMRGIAGIVAGIFLVLFGLKMLNVFPFLRNLQFRAPGFINRLIGKNSNANPLVIGLLNGLMIACGPLQAIYIMAAGTGSALEGAKLLFIFALGTLPVMLGFGIFTSFVSNKLTSRILRFSGAVVIILGLLMLNNGLVLSGSGLDLSSKTLGINPNGAISDNSDTIAVQKDAYQDIYMTVDSRGFTPSTFTLKKGIPVRWHINGVELNSCNNAIQVPAYNLQFDVRPGQQVIEFTPSQVGTIRWSCWMGMIQGSFIVTDTGTASQEQIQQTAAAAPATHSCGCGMK